MPDKGEFAHILKERIKDGDNLKEKHKIADNLIIEILEYEGGWGELIEEYKGVIKEE